ncbi:MAG: VWA domain-containing protein [Gaiellales bacterium]
MSFARPWWLCALALLVPLLILHLRRPALTVREVPSLLVWERLTGTAASDTRRLRRPRHLLLLGLQAFVISALVIALAGPERRSSTAPSSTVFVVDDSFWMQAGTRIADARSELVRLSASAPGPVTVVSASTTPAVLYHGGRSGLSSRAQELQASATSGDLSAAITLGAGLLGVSAGRLVVLRAPEDPLPSLHAAHGQLDDRVIGTPLDDQGIFAPTARCGIGPNDACEVLATLRNGSSTPRTDRYTASVPGRRTVSFRSTVPAHASTTIALTAQPGQRLQLRLRARDALPIDNTVQIAVPGTDNAPAAATVTLVGDPTSALPLAQAFASVPGVTLLLRTPKSYRARDARRSELVVLDGSLPASGLPAAPAVLLISPPSLPGGSVGGAIAAPAVSSIAASSPLVEGVDLTSLSIGRGVASVLSLPPWMSPIVSSPDGPLFAAGDDGRQRVAVLAFDPVHSNLAQLAALPILARNLVGWADAWTTLGADGTLSIDAIPGATQATLSGGSAAQTFALVDGGVGLTGVAPGTHTVAARGPSVVHRRTLVSALAAPAQATNTPGGAPIDLSSWASAASRPAERTFAAWLIVLALAAMVAEWATWRRVHR